MQREIYICIIIFVLLVNILFDYFVKNTFVSCNDLSDEENASLLEDQSFTTQNSIEEMFIIQEEQQHSKVSKSLFKGWNHQNKKLLKNIGILLCFCLSTILTADVYDGWDTFYFLLYKGGIFNSYCINQTFVGNQSIVNSSFSPSIVSSTNTEIYCQARKEALNNLFTITVTVELMFAPLAGFMLDKYGSKITAAFGLICAVFSWIFLALGNVINNATNFIYPYISVILMGLSAQPFNMCFVCVCELFPDKKLFVLSIVGACIKLSVIVPSILSYIYSSAAFDSKDFWKISFMYIGAVLLIVLPTIIFLVPFKSFQNTQNEDNIEEVEEKIIYERRNEKNQNSFWFYVKQHKYFLGLLFFFS